MLNAATDSGWPHAGHRGPGSMEEDAERRIRVCLACQSFHPVYAGAAIRFRRYAPGLRERGIDVEVFCGTPTAIKARMVGAPDTWSAYPEGALMPIERVDGLRVQRVRLPDESSPRRGFLFTWALSQHLRRSSRRPDVVQTLALPPVGVPGLWGVRRLGLPIVYTGTLLSELPRGAFRRPLAKWVRAAPLRLVDHVVVSSEVMRDHFLGLGVRCDVEVIGNGVDLRRFRAPRCADDRLRVRAALGINRLDPVVLFVGSVIPRKGVDLLLEAWHRLPATESTPHLVIVGPRRDREDPAHRAFHRGIEARVRGLPAPERVHFVEFTPRVEDYYRAADVFVLPSQREGMGNTVLEAMASGLPVVLTPYTGLPAEFGRAREHYVLAPATSEGLSAGLGELIEDAGLRRRIGLAALERARRHLGVEASLDRYADLYRRVAAAGPGGVLPWPRLRRTRALGNGRGESLERAGGRAIPA